MKVNKLFLLPALAAASASAATVEEILVRQQWPWSTEVKVEYRISGVDAPVSLKVEALDGETPLAIPNGAIRGDVYGIAENGIGTIRIDVERAFGREKTFIADFSVRLTPVAAAANLDEVVYKIVDLDAITVTDVTRKEILNGKYGDYETDYGKVGPGFSTSLDDVLVWTGVTNYPNVRTSNYVLRKIPAAGKSFAFLASGTVASFSHDYWMGVFEVTQGHLSRFPGSELLKIDGVACTGWETNALYAAERAANYGYYWNYRSNSGTDWPKSKVSSLVASQSSSSVAHLRWLFQEKFGEGHELCLVDLPTEAQWEFACRAGTTADLYSGKAATAQNFAEIGRVRGVNCRDAKETETEADPNYPSVNLVNRNCGLEYGANRPGMYLPNAFGLYDMLGNVDECCLDQYGDQVGGVDSKGPDSGTYYHRTRGGNYGWGISDATCAARYHGLEANRAMTGFRLCLQTHDF